MKDSFCHKDIDIILQNPDDPADRFIFPLLPEEIKTATASHLQSYMVMDLGEVKFPQGDKLTTFSWNGILPGKKRMGEPYLHGEWQDPLEIQSMFSFLRVDRLKKILIVTHTPINHPVYLDNYSILYKGPSGDYEYHICFTYARDIGVYTENSVPVNTGTGDRQPKDPGDIHTVQPGDNLWKIAEKYTGSGNQYPLLYELNKDMIGPDPALIQPGQILQLP